MLPQKYVKKDPVVIEALQYNGDNLGEISNFVGTRLSIQKYDQMCFPFAEPEQPNHRLYLRNNNNLVEINVSDYVIKTSNNIFYPCKKELFESTYVKQDDQNG